MIWRRESKALAENQRKKENFRWMGSANSSQVKILPCKKAHELRDMYANKGRSRFCGIWKL